MQIVQYFKTQHCHVSQEASLEMEDLYYLPFPNAFRIMFLTQVLKQHFPDPWFQHTSTQL